MRRAAGSTSNSGSSSVEERPAKLGHELVGRHVSAHAESPADDPAEASEQGEVEVQPVEDPGLEELDSHAPPAIDGAVDLGQRGAGEGLRVEGIENAGDPAAVEAGVERLVTRSTRLADARLLEPATRLREGDRRRLLLEL
jgi:hypothetical protein